MQAFYNEVAIMKRVSRRGHPHVITMVGYIPRDYPLAIVMEFAPLSTLLKFLIKVKDEVSVVHINLVLVVCSIQPHQYQVRHLLCSVSAATTTVCSCERLRCHWRL